MKNLVENQQLAQSTMSSLNHCSEETKLRMELQILVKFCFRSRGMNIFKREENIKWLPKTF